MQREEFWVLPIKEFEELVQRGYGRPDYDAVRAGDFEYGDAALLRNVVEIQHYDPTRLRAIQRFKTREINFPSLRDLLTDLVTEHALPAGSYVIDVTWNDDEPASYPASDLEVPDAPLL